MTLFGYVVFYVILGYFIAWLFTKGIPAFIKWFAEGVKKVLQIVFGVLGTAALIGLAVWAVTALMV